MGKVKIVGPPAGGSGAQGAAGTTGRGAGGQGGKGGGKGGQKKKKKEDCKKKLSKSKKKKLRQSTPNAAMNKAVNTPPKCPKPKKCPACGQSTSTFSADHLVPVDTIMRMPGFPCLSESNQKDMVNNTDNAMPLCVRCNKSKGKKLWWKWKGRKGTVTTAQQQTAWQQKVQDLGRQTNDMIPKLKDKIQGMPWS